MRGYVLSVWNVLDPLYLKFTRLCCLPDTDETSNIFRVRLTCYKGRDITLSDGTQIKKNDTLVKIHLHNVRLLNELKHISSELKKSKIVYEKVQKSLPGIEAYISSHKYENEIKGIIGITTLNRGCERLGFEVRCIAHPVYKWLKWASFLPIMCLSVSKPSMKKLVKQGAPSYLFMSKEKLIHIYKN
ncbi:hypothetical protein D0469_05560 [Peribacillus saganii]|uniref:YkoP-like domain-containing protein n=1 Tax=Peribacillus saganii TaxID=2303992 RepID=A0A372LR53_9BACI|nr:hypothetical protein [Peribacillus saganii]RFU70678.1 hypothetical protein D0469_05560 [Peribacillus saganii]